MSGNVSENYQKVLDEETENATLLNELLAEISHAAKEQTIGIAEISKAISQLDSNTSSNTETAKISEFSSRDCGALNEHGTGCSLIMTS